jgi:glycosyltransferase 2 family protein
VRCYVPVTAPNRLHRAGALAARIGALRPADPNLRRGLYAGITVIVLLSVGLAALTNLNELPDLQWRFQPAWLAVAILGFAGLQLTNAELWRRVLHALGPVITPRWGIAIWCASALGRYVPTSLLLPVIRVAMAEREGVPKRICLASVVYEVALAFTAALAVAAYFVINLPELEGRPVRFLVLVLPVLALVVLQPAIFHRVADFALERLGRLPLPLSLSGSRILAFVGLYALTFVLGGLSLYALAQSIYPLDGSDAVTVVGALAVGTTLSVLAFMVPGGLVAREAGVALALSPVMPTGPAVTIAVLLRIVQLGIELLLAVVAPLVAKWRDSALARSTRAPAAKRPTGVATR